ncbi:DUF5060 domain-containing protein [Martelella soudanensis]|uniref:DUF5060 domain-containing protein n=1 Tax=unclassified Martelella TaxID=2629616 RepID=UPI0015DEF267|nr:MULTISPECIES: DUF5060 domain-containing protein [unclassified Martelella]
MSDAHVEKWSVFETSFEGPSSGNPFVDVSFDAIFVHKSREVRVPGFYDGDGIYRVRFMPDVEGVWSFRTRSQAAALDGQAGSFNVSAASDGNHGPVRVRNRFHFGYEDGTPFFSFGTTCYAWVHQPLDMQKQTLETLKKTGFNKIRMGVFPKDYPYNTNEALHDCFERGPDGKLDFNRPNPVFFRHFESQVAALCALGIEADIIVFHPYDRWGYADMSEEQDYRYVAYLAARLAAYRNVWWSLANEYDFLLDTKPMSRWDRFFHILEENDAFQHLRSIHNGEVTANYDHRKPWVTHVCIQNPDVKLTQEWRNTYGKPVVNDEPEYEGDILECWGNLTPEELVHRYWITMTRGGYVGHGETYSDPDDLIWWAKGGKLHGEAWKRIAFLREILEQDVKHGLDPIGPVTQWPWSRASGARDGDGDFRLIYLGEHQPVVWSSGLPLDDGDYDVDVIDTWEMTVTPAERIAAPVTHPVRHGAIVRGGKADAAFGVRLPRKPHLALRVRKKR